MIKQHVADTKTAYFTNIWNELHNITPSVNYNSSQLPSLNEIHSCIAGCDYRVIELARVNYNDRKFLKNKGLSLSYLNANRFDVIPSLQYRLSHTSFANYTKKLITKSCSLLKTQQNHSQVYDAEKSTKFQHRIVQEGVVRAICPWTGKHLTSNKSYLFSPFKWTASIAYRFLGKEIFYLLTHTHGRCYQKLVIYIPKYEVLIPLSYIGIYPLESEIDCLKTHFISNSTWIKKSLKNDGKKRKTICISVKHFAHHLWNELSGLYRLKEAGLLDSVDRFLVFAEPLGPINRIFPEIDPRKIKRVDIPLMQDQFAKGTVVGNNDFICRIGYNYIASGLAERVRNVSRQLCSPEFISNLEESCRDCHPLVWVTIRKGNRTWISQVEGLINLATELARQFKRPGIVFDGISIPYRAPSDYLDSLKAGIGDQREILREIQDNVPLNIRLFDAIGLKLFESITWSSLVDFYIAHHGTMQHKIGWIANKPGIIHCNEKCFRVGKNHCTFWARENCIEPYLVSGVSDCTQPPIKLEGDLRTNLDNYDISWKSISFYINKLMCEDLLRKND
jgi:hypothetical protein